MARRYAIIGTGGRCEMYVRALLTTHADVGEIVALLDTNDIRMEHYARLAADLGQRTAIGRYHPDELEELIALERPDVLVVTSVDRTHARYVVAGLERGIDVVCEKPMTVDLPSLQRIVAAAEASTASLTVTFNYRYSPRNTLVRRLVADGEIGEVTSVHFEWCLDTIHGADYFRRWHREKDSSGGLLVHKSTHHFDLVNWWIDAVPRTVFALGGLRFYGAANAARRGEAARPPLGRDLVGSGDPFALDLSADPRLRSLFLDAEHLDGYHRDRDVFSEGITIEDTLTVAVGYVGGASLAYSLTANAPWEGYRVAINGTRGRIELDVVERGAVQRDAATTGIGPHGKRPAVVDPSAQEADDDSSGRRHGSRVLLQRQWEPAREIPIPAGQGAHGGGDAVLLDAIFRGVDDDPLRHHAGYLDGVRSVVVGVAANESLASGESVHLQDYRLPLEQRESVDADG